MTKFSRALAALSATGLVVAGLVAASPAIAAPSSAGTFPGLPATDKLIGVDCNSTNGVYSIAVTATTAQATPIGSVVGNANGTPASDGSTECSRGIAFNPVDGFVYGSVRTYNSSNQLLETSTSAIWLFKVDVSTGAQTLIGEFTGPCAGAWGFAIDNNGVAYATSSPNLCTVNLSTAETTEIGTDVIDGTPIDNAMGFDGKTNTLYVFGNDFEIYSVDTTTGAATLEATLAASYTDYDCGAYDDGASFSASAGFDSNGIAWIQSDTCGTSMPVAWDPATDNFWYTGITTAATDVDNTDGEAIYAAGDDFYMEGFTVVRGEAAPALAETGVDANEVPAGALLGAGLVLAGAVAVVVRRRAIAKR